MISIEELFQTARYCIKRDAIAELAAATLEWDSERKHLHLSFFLEGIAQDIDLGPLELAVTEIIAAHWKAIETVGTSYVFDKTLLALALESPALIFTRPA